MGEDVSNIIYNIIIALGGRYYKAKCCPNASDVVEYFFEKCIGRRRQKMEKINVDTTLKELEPHGTAEFPAAVYEDNCEIFRAVYTHWHKEMEIIYITKGKGIVRLDKERYLIRKGDLIVIPKEVIHYLQSDKKDVLYFKSLVFDLNMLASHSGDLCQTEITEPLIKKQVEMATILTDKDSGYELILDTYEKIIDGCRKREDFFYIEVKALFYRMFYELFSGKYIRRARQEERKSTAAMKTILSYIEEHYNEKLTVNELAEMIHYSDYYFMKVFKIYTGKTLMSYINEMRVEKSKYFLVNTQENISDIALETGFGQASYYIRKFQELQEMTPLQFRKRAVSFAEKEKQD